MGKKWPPFTLKLIKDLANFAHAIFLESSTPVTASSERSVNGQLFFKFVEEMPLLDSLSESLVEKMSDYFQDESEPVSLSQILIENGLGVEKGDDFNDSTSSSDSFHSALESPAMPRDAKTAEVERINRLLRQLQPEPRESETLSPMPQAPRKHFSETTMKNPFGVGDGLSTPCQESSANSHSSNKLKHPFGSGDEFLGAYPNLCGDWQEKKGIKNPFGDSSDDPDISSTSRDVYKNPRVDAVAKIQPVDDGPVLNKVFSEKSYEIRPAGFFKSPTTKPIAKHDLNLSGTSDNFSVTGSGYTWSKQNPKLISSTPAESFDLDEEPQPEKSAREKVMEMLRKRKAKSSTDSSFVTTIVENSTLKASKITSGSEALSESSAKSQSEPDHPPTPLRRPCKKNKPQSITLSSNVIVHQDPSARKVKPTFDLVRFLGHNDDLLHACKEGGIRKKPTKIQECKLQMVTG